jgi:hypothetical protein
VGRRVRILDFDIETRLVGFHKGGKFNPDGCEPIAIAWSFGRFGENRPIRVRQLGVDEPEEMLTRFLTAYMQADMVTGHYIRKFDLPIINGALMERNLGTLPPKMTCDTKNDLITKAGWSSSQENLGEMIALAEDKFHMNDTRWREATRLTPKGIALTRERVVDDVKQHIELRYRLLALGWLGAPKVWKP